MAGPRPGGAWSSSAVILLVIAAVMCDAFNHPAHARTSRAGIDGQILSSLRTCRRLHPHTFSWTWRSPKPRVWMMGIGGVDRGDFRGDYGKDEPAPEGSGMPGESKPSAKLLTIEFEGRNAEENVREWARRFSYAAALPVQPLFTRETPRGLELIFRKKPTKERGSEDGGLRIEVIVASATWDSHRWPGATRGTGDDSRSRSPEVGRKGGAEAEDAPRCTLVVSRIAEGQDIGKVFSEEIIVNKLVDGAKELGPDEAKVISLVKNTDIRPA